MILPVTLQDGTLDLGIFAARVSNFGVKHTPITKEHILATSKLDQELFFLAMKGITSNGVRVLVSSRRSPRRVDAEKTR